MTPQPTFFTRDFALLFVANFLVVAVYFLLMTTMAVYAVQAYGVEGSLAGLTASIFLVGGVLGRVISGRYAQHVGLRRMTVIALVIQVLACALYFADALGVAFLLFVRLLHGFSFGLVNTTIPALAVDAMPRERIGEGTGYFMLSQSFASGVGPVMGIVVALGIDYALIFVICACASVVAMVTALLVGRRKGGSRAGLSSEGLPFSGGRGSENGVDSGSEGKSPFAVRSGERAANMSPECQLSPEGKRPLGPWSVRSIIDVSTVKYSAFMFLVAFAYSGINAFLNSYAASLGLGLYAPFTFLVYAVTLVVTRPIAGRIMDRHGERVVLYVSTVAMALGLALAACTVNAAMLLALGVFMALGFGTSMSTGQAAATRRTTSGNTALAISTFFLLCDAGCGIGPYFLGFIVEAWGYRGMYALCAAIAVAAFAYCLAIFRKSAAPSN